MEVVAEFGGDEARVVVVEAADGDGVVEKNAMVGYVDHVDSELPSFAERMARGGVEGGVDGEVGAVEGALVGAGEAVGET